MNGQTFGEYLRSLRKKQNPPMTQEQLAKAIGRSKMTVSQFENGKNAPPQGELLENIIATLTITEEQESRLRFLSSESRRTIPGDIEAYFFNNPSICKAIRAAQAISKGDSFWDELSERLGKNND